MHYFYIKITLYYDNMGVGSIIKTRRKTLKVSQSQLADLANISVNTLYKIEREQGNPTLDTLEKIGDILGMELYLRIKQNKKAIDETS